MTDKTQNKKQFIAGAKCPSCNELDVLVFYHQDDKPVRECVECEFREELGEDLEEEKEQSNAALEIKIIEL